MNGTPNGVARGMRRIRIIDDYILYDDRCKSLHDITLTRVSAAGEVEDDDRRGPGVVISIIVMSPPVIEKIQEFVDARHCNRASDSVVDRLAGRGHGRGVGGGAGERSFTGWQHIPEDIPQPVGVRR